MNGKTYNYLFIYLFKYFFYIILQQKIVYTFIIIFVYAFHKIILLFIRWKIGDLDD